MKIEPTKRMREEGWTSINGHLRPPLSPALEGAFQLIFWMDPPTATHHDKEIAQVFGKGGRRHSTLRNSPALNAAWAEYLSRTIERRTLVPLMPPVELAVMFGFRCPQGREALDGLPYCHKPDLDNSVKVLKDVLALRGYLVADEQVFSERLLKVWARRPFVYVRGQSLPASSKLTLQTPNSDPFYEVFPVDWKIRQDRDMTARAAVSSVPKPSKRRKATAPGR